MIDLNEYRERRGAHMKTALRRYEQAFKEIEALLPSAVLKHDIKIAVVHQTGEEDWLDVTQEQLLELYLNPPPDEDLS